MIKFIGQLVCDLGVKLISWRKSSKLRGSWQGSQLKTKADIDAHNFITTNLMREFPGIPIISEEAPEQHTAERPAEYWLVDPIDGTASYAQNYNGFVTQIALIKNKKPVIASIYAPMYEELFLAEVGSGAELNGKPIKLESNTYKPKTLIDNTPKPFGKIKKLFKDLDFEDYVESGSISLKACRVAQGNASLFVKLVSVSDWDIGAPYLIVKESGGQLRGLGSRSYNFSGAYQKPGIIIANTKPLIEEADQWIKLNN